MFRANNVYSSLVMVLLFVATAVNGQVANRDPQAIAVLSQTLNAAGGVKALATIQDYIGTGTVNFYWANQATGNVTVQGRGIGQFRMDATLPEGVRSVIVNNGSGEVIEANGSVENMTYGGASNLGSATFPLMTTLALSQGQSLSISYVGLVNHLGSLAHEIRFQTAFPSDTDPAGLLTLQSIRDVFIDPSTFLPVSILDQVNATPDDSGIPHEIIFGNWQQVNGIAVPFLIIESVRNQSLVSIQLTQVTFNNNLTDATFTQ